MLAAILGSGFVLVMPSLSRATTQIVVTDNFNRNVLDWGSAQTGGAYAYLANDNPQSFATNGQSGIISSPSGIKVRSASLDNATAADSVESAVRFSISALPTGGPVDILMALRNQPDGSSYVAAVRIKTNGSGTFGFYIQDASGHLNTVGTWQTLPADVAAGVPWRVRAQVSRTTTVLLRQKVWKAANPEPSLYKFSATDTAASVFLPGTYGLGVASTVNQTGHPDVSFDTYSVTTIDEAALPQAPITVTGGSFRWRSVPSTSVSACCVQMPSGAPAFDHYEYRTVTNGALASTNVGASVPITAEGFSWVQFRAVDVQGSPYQWYPPFLEAGNTVRIDRSPPTDPLVMGGAAEAQNVSSITIYGFGAKDAVSDSALNYENRISTDDGASWTAPAAGTSVTLTTQGKRIVQFRATDEAGNASAWAPSLASPDVAYATSWIDPSAPVSGTTVPAGTTISTDTTWNPANGPYRLSGSGYVSVAQGAKLTIQPGTRVEGTSQGVYLRVAGRLDIGAVGGAKVSVQNSGGLIVASTGTVNAYGVNFIHNAQSQAPDETIDVEGGGHLFLHDSNVVRSNGVGISGGQGSYLLLDNVNAVQNARSGLEAIISQVDIDHSSFIDNGRYGIVWYFAAAPQGVAKAGHISGSEVSFNDDGGILVFRGPDGEPDLPYAVDNNIFGNGPPETILDPNAIQSDLTGRASSVLWTHNFWGYEAVQVICPPAQLAGHPNPYDVGSISHFALSPALGSPGVLVIPPQGNPLTFGWDAVTGNTYSIPLPGAIFNTQWPIPATCSADIFHTDNAAQFPLQAG